MNTDYFPTKKICIWITEIYRVLKPCLDSLSSSVIGDISNTFQPTRQETKGKSSQTEKSLMAKQSGGRE